VHGLCSIAVLALIEDGLALVVFGAIAFAILISLAYLLTRGSGESAYDRIGAGGLSSIGDHDRDAGAGAGAGGSPAARGASTREDRGEQEREIRQMLGARSERLMRSGQPALDVDAEVARLLGEQGGQASNSHDPALLAEVRQLAVARNERRLRQGLEALDIDAEVARTLDELEP
jgi:hypothetical protein